MERRINTVAYGRQMPQIDAVLAPILPFSAPIYAMVETICAFWVGKIRFGDSGQISARGPAYAPDVTPAFARTFAICRM